MARTYGWTARVVERELTDEQLVLYLDAAVDRQTADAETTFVRMVETTRIGTIFAHDGKQYGKWSRSLKGKAGRGSGALKGETLENVIRTFALQHPEYVTVGAP